MIKINKNTIEVIRLIWNRAINGTDDDRENIYNFTLENALKKNGYSTNDRTIILMAVRFCVGVRETPERCIDLLRWLGYAIEGETGIMLDIAELCRRDISIDKAKDKTRRFLELYKQRDDYKMLVNLIVAMEYYGAKPRDVMRVLEYIGVDLKTK